MRVYVLDTPGKYLEQMLQWLSENKIITGVQAFEDYIEFIEQVAKSPPDLCIIRLGVDTIPGIKTADMVHCINLETRIVFISEDRDYAMDAYEIGAYGYLLCPVEKEKFEKCLFSVA